MTRKGHFDLRASALALLLFGSVLSAQAVEAASPLERKSRMSPFFIPSFSVAFAAELAGLGDRVEDQVPTVQLETAHGDECVPALRAGEEERTVWRALAELPEAERALVEGVYREGRSYQEMADATSIPLGTLKRRLRESLARLRRRLETEAEDG